MHNKDMKNPCMACFCPCDMHKEHTHGDEHKDEGKKEGMYAWPALVLATTTRNTPTSRVSVFSCVLFGRQAQVSL